MPITKDDILKQTCPFYVKLDGKRGKPIGKSIEVSGFSENDPLGVGGWMLPDMPVIHFSTGGWLLVGSLMEYYSLAPMEASE